MIDTIHLWFPYGEIDCTDEWLVEIYGILENATMTEKRDSGFKFVSGYLANIKVEASARGLRILGSIPKFIYGNNFEQINIEDIALFIDTINSVLPLQAENGIITRLDFGYNLVCDYPIKSYYPFFTASQHFQKSTLSNSVYFKNGNRQVVFYDKIAQARKEKDEIPERYRQKQVLRLEARWLNSQQIKKYLNTPSRLFCLQKKEVWDTLPEIWKSMYFHLNREVEINFDHQKLKSPKDFYSWLAVRGIMAEGGMDGVNQFIEAMKGFGAFKFAPYYSLSKRKCRSLVKKFSCKKANPLILELDSKVKAAC